MSRWRFELKFWDFREFDGSVAVDCYLEMPAGAFRTMCPNKLASEIVHGILENREAFEKFQQSLKGETNADS